MKRTHEDDRRPHPPHYADRPYENMPSITSRAWGPADPHEDRFGYAGIGGYGDFREAVSRGEGESHGSHQRGPQQRAGGHRGRGPRGARPDAAIADEIYYQLTEDPYVDAGEILVSVEGGVVLLTGEVPQRRMKHRAEDIVADIRGVQEVNNRIRISKGLESVSDEEQGGLRAGDSQKGSGFSSQSPGHGVRKPGERYDDDVGFANRP